MPLPSPPPPPFLMGSRAVQMSQNSVKKINDQQQQEQKWNLLPLGSVICRKKLNLQNLTFGPPKKAFNINPEAILLICGSPIEQWLLTSIRSWSHSLVIKERMEGTILWTQNYDAVQCPREDVCATPWAEKSAKILPFYLMDMHCWNWITIWALKVILNP